MKHKKWKIESISPYKSWQQSFQTLCYEIIIVKK